MWPIVFWTNLFYNSSLFLSVLYAADMNISHESLVKDAIQRDPAANSLIKSTHTCVLAAFVILVIKIEVLITNLTDDLRDTD